MQQAEFVRGCDHAFETRATLSASVRILCLPLLTLCLSLTFHSFCFGDVALDVVAAYVLDYINVDVIPFFLIAIPYFSMSFHFC